MNDNELSTRDLASRSGDEHDRTLESRQPAHRSAGTSTAGDQDPDSGFENAQADQSLTRDPAAAGHASSDTRAADSGVDPAADGGGRNLDSSSGDTGMHDLPSASADHEPLFATDQSERFTSRWQEVQTSFVDQPREAVAEADALVADLMQRLAASFSQERERLEAQWDRGDDVSTEDLRVALTRYRSFFDRLLSA